MKRKDRALNILAWCYRQLNRILPWYRLPKILGPNLVNAVRLAHSVGAGSIGIVGKNGGETAKFATVTILIPEKDEQLVTPLTEGVQAIVWHILASHPVLQANEAKWESEVNA